MKQPVKLICLICLGLLMQGGRGWAWDGSSSGNYGADRYVVNAFGGTSCASSGNYAVMGSGGQTGIGQAFSDAYSAQVGFFNDYFQVVPTPTITPTSAPTAVVTVTPVITATPPPPDKFIKIFGSKLNPNNGEQARIRWSQPHESSVTITVYNMVGDKIVTLVEHRVYPKGQYNEVKWDGKNNSGQTVGSGIYIVHLKTDGYEGYSKCAVIK